MREKQEEKQEKASSRPFQGIFLPTLIFLAILRHDYDSLKASTWCLMLVLHAIISYDKVYGWFMHDKQDYSMKQA